jgi:sulfhydrogenase subunit beta (sulfur reductase)
METVTITAAAFSAFVDACIKEKSADIIGPVAQATRFSYEALGSAADMRLDYDETTQSPRKFLMPPRDPLLSFTTRDSASCRAVYDEKQRVIIGVHPGDLAAIALYDKAYSSGEADEQYCARRSNTVLIGLYPTRAWKYRFTSSMIKESDPYLSADLMMVDMGDKTYAVEIVTDRGRALIAKAKTQAAPAAVVAAMAGRKRAVKDELSLPVKHDELPKKLAGQERHETFTRRGDKCFSCGSCVLVCPTCVCFDVRDKVDLSLATGQRYRTWDGCTLENFATCAGGHNFRKKAADRLRHRLFRKAVYLKERFGITGCVGCGRCTAACTADIASIVDMVGDIAGKGK